MDEKWHNEKKNKGKEVIQSSDPFSRNSAAAKESFKHDVFFSFSDKDYRSFARFLLHQLKNAGLNFNYGSDIFIPVNPMEAIEHSKLCLLIFTPDYASTESCLDEVAKMNECRKTSGRIVLPIFYMIKPSDVRKQTGPFEESFRGYQKKQVDSQVINKWKVALTEIGSLEGLTVTGYDIYVEKHVEEIFEQVIKLLFYEVPLDNNLVGIEQSYQSVIKMLQIGCGTDARIVGICGMPGIGKTTLAKSVYNNLCRLFECCSFVSSIQERSGKNGLHYLQVQFIKDLLNANDACFRSFEDNIEFIKERFRYTRVLIVLDGVECADHIKAFGVGLRCFGHGSRIILTTRKSELLVEAKVKIPYRYFLEELDELHALNLFHNHAFKNDSPEEDYRHLSTQIASSARGIPLVIESVGSYLSNYRNKEKERWEEVLQQLRSCQYRPLQELLMLSHDYSSRGRWNFYHDEECFHVGEKSDITHYNVVLSFDARDKVKNVVESLHKRMESFGIGIFAINGECMQANGTGKILIPVISKSYASNSLCLEMLVHMEECRRSSATNHILPIYCGIAPSDVRLPTPLHESCSGWSLSESFTIEEFDNLIKSVCQMALDKLKLNQAMENHLVGIQRHVKSILGLLNPEVNDVRSVVIRGEGGTGKTTLATFVYHQLSSSYEGCSFLTEIAEMTQNPDGIKYLQAKLISDLLNKEREVFASVAEGINLIKERFQQMKVLIVLDDVAESSHVEDLVGQLHWFGLGSRIVITANVRNEILLPHSDYLILDGHFDKASELLRMRAFRKGNPLPKFKLLSKHIADGLCLFRNPWLALEIVGSLLYGKDEKEWKNMLQDLGDMDLQKILRMSYGRLNEMQKQIFLDITCFPSGMDRRVAKYLWCDSLHSPGSTNTDLEALILLYSLVKVDANNQIWMHRLVRKFGREILDQESQQSKGAGETKPVRSEVLDAQEFERMSNIKFFKLDHANINGSTNRFLMRQRDFIWEWWPWHLLATLHSERLKILDMSWSKVTEDWEGWHQIKVPQLRVLNLTGCSDLMLTPVFSFCPKLEMLILEHCSRLVKIDPSIGKLESLTTLNLRYCLELCTLPKEVGYLTALEELPLDGTSVRALPVSIGRLKNLHILTAINCLSLRHLPSSTCDLWSVTVVKLNHANITELPCFIGKMKLRHLSLRGCRGIKGLESLVGEIESSLVELDVSKTSISELPKSIIKLKALRVLKMEFCFIIEFPPCFGELKKLKEIHASWCRSLENLPNDIGKLESLRILKVGHSRISCVPQSIKMLACLETLDCTSCSNLQNLPELPSSLTFLHVETKELKKLPNFTLLERLQVLTLVNGDLPDVSMAVTAGRGEPFNWLKLPSLRTLELCLSNIKSLPSVPYSLRKLSLRCASLEYIPFFPESLVSLSIRDCTSLKQIPCIKYAEALEEMEILHCPGIKRIDGLEELRKLKVLTISSSGIVSLYGLDKLTSLMRLTLSDCPEIKRVKGLEKLQALVFLTISSSRIVSLTGLDKLASLRNLTLSDCSELKHVEGLAKLQTLEVLTISGCRIVSLTGLDKLASVKKLTLLNCGSLSEFPDLSTLKGVDVFIPENSY